jgi:hypothetical protein
MAPLYPSEACDTFYSTPPGHDEGQYLVPEAIPETIPEHPVLKRSQRVDLYSGPVTVKGNFLEISDTEWLQLYWLNDFKGDNFKIPLGKVRIPWPSKSGYGGVGNQVTLIVDESQFPAEYLTEALMPYVSNKEQIQVWRPVKRSDPKYPQQYAINVKIDEPCTDGNDLLMRHRYLKATGWVRGSGNEVDKAGFSYRFTE